MKTDRVSMKPRWLRSQVTPSTVTTLTAPIANGLRTLLSAEEDVPSSPMENCAATSDALKTCSSHTLTSSDSFPPRRNVRDANETRRKTSAAMDASIWSVRPTSSLDTKTRATSTQLLSRPRLRRGGPVNRPLSTRRGNTGSQGGIPKMAFIAIALSCLLAHLLPGSCVCARERERERERERQTDRQTDRE